jgi:hypothetical protein
MNEPGDAEDLDLIEELASFACRPRAFVYWAFPWGEPGELERRKGLEPWQDEALTYIEQKLIAGLSNIYEVIGEAIQLAVKSGHDIGKSAFVCWIIIWAISTREDTKGVVTANTEKQLRLKLWAELAKWHRLFIARSLFKVTATSIQASDPEREKEWRIDAIPWSEDNPEAFAGLHNFGKRVLVIFDEASGIVDKIWETIDGVMNEAETELIWICTGNPTRNTGRFRECFDKLGQGQFWRGLTVDSREVSFTNKERIAAQIALWGIESDFIKVRWLGQFPESGNLQLIPSDVIQGAMLRDAQSFIHEPLVLGVDVARMGDNESVAQFRRGNDARSIPTFRWKKTTTTELGGHIANLINTYSPDAVFIDEGGVGGGVIDFLRLLGYSVIGVNFGSTAMIPLGGEKCYNKRAEMYVSTRTWLHRGAIPNDQQLFKELVSIEMGHAKQGKLEGAILLAPKEELDESPDWADALVLTFAFPVSMAFRDMNKNSMKSDYDPLDYARVSSFSNADPKPLFDPKNPGANARSFH